MRNFFVILVGTVLLIGCSEPEPAKPKVLTDAEAEAELEEQRQSLEELGY
jgi:PBP1b-binding outer membrane lipoprotein LpoB